MSEYPAYDDEKILDLTPDRLMQMVEVIQIRQQEHLELNQKILLGALEVHARSVTGGLMAAVQSKPSAKWLSDYVKKMQFIEREDTEEEEKLPSTASVLAAFGADQKGLFGKRA